MKKYRYILLVALSILALMVVPDTAFATTTGVNTVTDAFKAASSGWYTEVKTVATEVFGALFGIELTWIAVQWLITGKDVHEIFTSFIKKLISIGFFFLILLNGHMLSWDVIQAFQATGVAAAGAPHTGMGWILDTGLKIFDACMKGPKSTSHGGGMLWGLLPSAKATISDVVGALVGIFVGLVAIFALIYMALEYLAVQIEAILVTSLGVILLGFGGSRFTASYVESYIKYAVSVGIRFFVLLVWVAFIENQAPGIITNLIAGVEHKAGGTITSMMAAYGDVLIFVLLIAWLTKKLPSIAASVLTGSSSLSGGELVSGVVKGAALATAAAATGGAAAMGVAGLAGGTAAGGLGAATGAAGSAGAGSLSAAGGAAGVEASTGMAAPKAASGSAAPGAASGAASGGTSPGGASSGGVPAPKVSTGTTANRPATSGANGAETKGQSSGEAKVPTAQAPDESRQETDTQHAEGQEANSGVAEARALQGDAPLQGAEAEQALSRVGTSVPAPPVVKPGSAQTPSGGKGEKAGGVVFPSATVPAKAVDLSSAAPERSTVQDAAPSMDAPLQGDAPQQGVDHRPSAPNEAPLSSGEAGKGTQAPVQETTKAPTATQAGPSQAPASRPVSSGATPLQDADRSSGSGKGAEAPEPKSPSFLDRAGQHEKALNHAHETLLPGEAPSGGVTAPGLNVKHLSD